jgi:hypothetical protein
MVIRYKGKVDSYIFIRRISKLFQEKNETVSDFAERCITEMREFINSIEPPADDQFPAQYLAPSAAEKAKCRNAERSVFIVALAKGYFMMGVNQAIKIPLMQKNPGTLTEAIRDAMMLELINETYGTKNKIASLAEWDDSDLEAISEDLDDLTIKMINQRRAQYRKKPFKRGNGFSNGNGKSGKRNRGNGKSVIKCRRHCNKEGHMQLECRTRIKKNAPCVNRNGKPLPNQSKVA